MIRPMRVEDADAAHALAVETFEAYSRARGEKPDPRPDPVAVRPRYVELLRSDPGGTWVAEEGGRLVGCAIAIVREGIWGLSLLIVRPDRQSTGVGGELLRRAAAYGEGARGRIIMASRDPRALRAYARLGLTGHPAFIATGIPRGVAEPDGVREATPADQPFLDAVSRHVRGAAHGTDLWTFTALGATILIAEERGFAVVRNGGVRLLAAYDEAGARDVLRAALARADGEAAVEYVTAKQAWAVPVCLQAGLQLRAEGGPVFTGGDVGPFSPYIPSGAFL
jgi:GNAT superfamily N-acetyltransferase